MRRLRARDDLVHVIGAPALRCDERPHRVVDLVRVPGERVAAHGPYGEHHVALRPVVPLEAEIVHVRRRERLLRVDRAIADQERGLAVRRRRERIRGFDERRPNAVAPLEEHAQEIAPRSPIPSVTAIVAPLSSASGLRLTQTTDQTSRRAPMHSSGRSAS